MEQTSQKTCLRYPFGNAGPLRANVFIYGKGNQREETISKSDFRLRGNCRAQTGAYSPQLDAVNNGGVFDEVAEIGIVHNCSRMYWPSTAKFNAAAVSGTIQKYSPQGGWHLQSDRIWRGHEADAVEIVGSGEGAAVIQPTADCPTIIALNHQLGSLICAHGGRESLYPKQFFITGRRDPSRPHDSVVDTIMHRWRGTPVEMIEVITVCGISSKYFGHHVSDPKYGEHNRKMRDHFRALTSLEIDVRVELNLHAIIAKQFEYYGVTQIASDYIDTFGDLHADGSHMWHSARRDGATAGRNLVIAQLL